MAEAQRDGLLNKMHFIFVKYELFKHKTLKVEYAGGSFMTSENNQYEYFHNKFYGYIGAKEGLHVQMANGEIHHDDYEKEIGRLDYLIKMVSNQRKELLLKSDTNVVIIERIKTLLKSDDKTMVFSVLTEQSAKFCPFTYNGKNSATANKENFRKFNSGEISILGVCSKVNRGVNIHRMNTIIFETYYGSDTQATQRLGRGARLNPGEITNCYVMLPYFRRKDVNGNYILKETQQVTWCKNMLATTTVTSHETLDFRSV